MRSMKLLRACCAGALMVLSCASDHLVPSASAAVIFPTPVPTPMVDPCRFFTPFRTYIKASNTGAHDQFGGGNDGAIALSADGQTLAVGVPSEDSNATGIGGNQADNSADASGAVYIFVRGTFTWTQQAYIKASNAQAEDEFGTSVALSADGNTLVVGAPEEDSNATGVGGDGSNNSATDLGAAYVFTRSGTTWTEQAYLKPWDIYQNSASFGESVDINNDGTRIAVGAPCASNCKGSVFLFGLGGSGWTTRVQIPAPPTYADTQFGRVVALSGQGGTMAVGAPFDDSTATGINGNDSDSSGHSIGSVYVYVNVVIPPFFSFWTKQAYIKAADVDDGDTFGRSIALSDDGNVLAVGAPLEDGGSTGINGDQSSESASGSGAAYIFTRSGTAWSQETYFKAANAETADQFGKFVALDGTGTVLAVSAVEEDSSARCVGGDAGNNGASQSGAVYRFTRPNGSWAQESYVKAGNTEVQDLFGYGLSITGSGSTLAIGVIGEDSSATGINGNSADNSASWSGAAYLYAW
jgi:hypothetical protein